MFINLLINLSICLFVGFIHFFIYFCLSVCLFVCLLIYLLILTAHTPDYHCPGGEENRGFCDPYNGEPCPNVHHQRCHIERPGVNFYRDARGRQWPGICCSLDRPHPAHRIKVCKASMLYIFQTAILPTDHQFV